MISSLPSSSVRSAPPLTVLLPRAIPRTPKSSAKRLYEGIIPNWAREYSRALRDFLRELLLNFFAK
jgi:hypothetical protein